MSKLAKTYKTTTIEEVLFTKNCHSYVIIDSAKIRGLSSELLMYDLTYSILLKDEDAIALEEVAPYLIKLEREDAFSHWVLQEVYGELGAIFLQSKYALTDLSMHLKPYITTMVDIAKHGEEPQLSKAYLRLYDPRVFPDFITYLEAATYFWEYIEAILCEDQKSKNIRVSLSIQ